MDPVKSIKERFHRLRGSLNERGRRRAGGGRKKLIAATTTKAGLKVRAEIDPNSYPKGGKITQAEVAEINMTPDPFHGEWNYTIHPRP